MQLLYKTITVFDQVFTQEQIAEIELKINDLVAQGKTDGTRTATWPDLPATIVRPWATEADAEEWKEFCNSFTPAPTSCVVEPI
jgi:hypothetical protein